MVGYVPCHMAYRSTQSSSYQTLCNLIIAGDLANTCFNKPSVIWMEGSLPGSCSLMSTEPFTHLCLIFYLFISFLAEAPEDSSVDLNNHLDEKLPYNETTACKTKAMCLSWESAAQKHHGELFKCTPQTASIKLIPTTCKNPQMILQSCSEPEMDKKLRIGRWWTTLWDGVVNNLL